MFRTAYLFDLAGHHPCLRRSLLPGQSWPWRQVELVMPRALCMFEQLDISGVPRQKIRRYVSLQLEARGAFADSRHWVSNQGSFVNIWTWDGAQVKQFALSMGLDEDAILCVPQSEYAPKQEAGGVWVQDLRGTVIEAQLWRGARLVDSASFPALPSQESWKEWLASHQLGLNASTYGAGAGWSMSPPSRRAAYLHRFRSRNMVSTVALTQFMPTQAWIKPTLLLATLALVGVFAWFKAQTHTIERRGASPNTIEPEDATQTQRVRRLQQDLATSTQAVKRLQGLVAKTEMSDALLALSELVVGQGVSIRELELRGNTVQATVVSPNGNVGLSSFLDAVDASPLFTDARFVDVAGADGFKFTWRIRSAGPVASGLAGKTDRTGGAP